MSLRGNITACFREHVSQQKRIKEQVVDIATLRLEILALKRAITQIKRPDISPDFLRVVASHYECGDHCAFVGPMDMETGVRECDLGENCKYAIAEELRDLATALEATTLDVIGPICTCITARPFQVFHKNNYCPVHGDRT